MKIQFLFLFFIFLSSVLSTEAQPSVKYIFIGHCYQTATAGNKVDYRLEELDMSPYKGVWLGGDVCSEAMLNFSTVQYIDSLFHLNNPETHWTLGNHDARNGNWEWYEQLAERPTYYAYSSYGITRIVMNTNLVPTNCEMMNDEFNIITNVCDTIQHSGYLILLMHHGIWRDVPGLPPPPTYAQSYLRYWNANCDSVNTSFLEAIYPKLVEVKQRGIEVFCILGDMGSGLKTFEVDSDDGIHFLGCGLYHNEPEDNVLIFNYNIESKQLDYGFHNLDSLLLH